MSNLTRYPKKWSPVLGTVYYFDCMCAVVLRGSWDEGVRGQIAALGETCGLRLNWVINQSTDIEKERERKRERQNLKLPRLIFDVFTVFLIFVASPSSPHPGTLFTHLLKCNISDALAFLPPLQSLFSGLKVNNYKLFSSRTFITLSLSRLRSLPHPK